MFIQVVSCSVSVIRSIVDAIIVCYDCYLSLVVVRIVS
jgi:hypothetical protein